MKVVTVPDRPDLTERAYEQTYDTLREYNQHGDVLNTATGPADRGTTRVPVPPCR
jgi:hypothetical protein